jgi:hypothetical protein
MRRATALAILAAALPAGCGGSSGSSSTATTPPPRASAPAAPAGASAAACPGGSGAESLRATGVSCRQARRLLLGWRRQTGCSPGAGVSRSACSTGSYRCLATRTARGVAVDCSRPGRSVAFVIGRR